MQGLRIDEGAGAGRLPSERVAIEWLAAAFLLAGLAAVVGLRWAAAGLGLDPLVVGAAFGFGLAAVWAVGTAPFAPSSRVVRPDRSGFMQAPRPAAVGALAGAGLVAIAVLGLEIAETPRIPGLGRAAAAFPAWAAVTVLVAGAEEGILRSVLFARLRTAAGLPVAVGLTTVAFALMHVPLYGWHVVPLDLAVGLLLAALRLSTGTVLAPFVAHAVADLATWWL